MEVTLTLTRIHAERLRAFLGTLLNNTQVCQCDPCVTNIDLPIDLAATTPCDHGDPPLDSDEIHGCERNALFDVESQLFRALDLQGA